jgi:hypothetical protein
MATADPAVRGIGREIDAGVAAGRGTGRARARAGVWVERPVRRAVAGTAAGAVGAGLAGRTGRATTAAVAGVARRVDADVAGLFRTAVDVPIETAGDAGAVLAGDLAVGGRRAATVEAGAAVRDVAAEVGADADARVVEDTPPCRG